MTAKKLNFNEHKIKEIILKQARRENSIVFGGRAIKRKLGINARRTQDFDLFTAKPKPSALITESKLDRLFKKNLFYSKKGTNPGTYKVKFVGNDGIARNDDDVGIADYTRTPKPEPKTFLFRGVRYRKLSEELAAKKRIVRSPEFAFRHEKDRADIKRILRFGRKLFR